MDHINATKVFPLNLVKEIQKYYSGGYLWVSKQGNEERNEKICALYKNGKSIRDIDKKLNLSERRIRQIIQENLMRK